jgi:CO/xanthine dehydrogenase Mo-binding subunit
VPGAEPKCGVNRRASITLSRDGTARVRSAATDIGTGTYTVAAQLTAELLGLRTSQVVVEIGDSDLPPAPQSGGSGLATALSAAIHAAAGNLLRAFLDLAPGGSPLHGRSPDEVAVADGCILNEKLARSQILGVVVTGIGMTLFEETVSDPATGRIANATFADYLIPVSADIPDLDVIFVGEPDRSNQ